MAVRALALALAVPGHPGRDCEDAAGTSPEQDAVVLADGLGSARMGSLGSHTAVNLVLGPLRDELLGGLPVQALGPRLAELWQRETHGDRDVATTCLFALLRGDEIVLGQVGDGLVLAVDGAGRGHPLPSGRGQFGNQTDALPRGPLACACHRARDLRAVFLATDGVADDLVPGAEVRLVDELARILREQGAASFEDRLRSWLEHWPTPGSRDDRSVGLLVLQSSVDRGGDRDAAR